MNRDRKEKKKKRLTRLLILPAGLSSSYVKYSWRVTETVCEQQKKKNKTNVQNITCNILRFVLRMHTHTYIQIHMHTRYIYPFVCLFVQFSLKPDTQSRLSAILKERQKNLNIKHRHVKPIARTEIQSLKRIHFFKCGVRRVGGSNR